MVMAPKPSSWLLVEAVEHAQCWTHTRREFVKAEKAEPDIVAEALSLMGVLYRVETAIGQQGLTDAAKREYRQRHAKPAVDAFLAWCEAQCQRMDLAPSDMLSKALKYARKGEANLRIYFDDPNVPIDTNHVERTLRCIPMGRKAVSIRATP